MRGHERVPAFDISIHGDELEYNRIQLEHNLQHKELSFRLSSSSDDERHQQQQHHSKVRHSRRKNNNPNESSVEYPRHLSEPSFHEFSSIIRSTAGDHYADEESQLHPWSYRLGNDEEGINPYVGDTVSTAAHHASALTLSAGLGGGRGACRDASLSGVEYDPERPLHAMIAGVNSKHSMFDFDRSTKSKVHEEAHEVQQPHSSPRPKLTDHLRHVTFSPKRPRNAQASVSNHVPTPRPARKFNASPSYASSPAQPFHDVANQSEPTAAASIRQATPRKSSMRDSSKGKVYLPDVTALTNAVNSPARSGAEYYSYGADNRPRDSEARLLQTLSAVQSQLRDLEDENSISRRRVRELEMELEECKRHVARERTRLIERDELNDLGGYSGGKTIRNKGKGKAVEPSIGIDDERLHERYKDAVEEKKALEALINSLRSHLTRLTSELASHQDLLTELRNLRDSDSRSLKEKGAEIIKLREEVQRLAGEVEVLRGVIEEGLKERRASREIPHVEQSVADTAMSQDLEQEQEQEEGNEDEVEEDEDVPTEDDPDSFVSYVMKVQTERRFVDKEEIDRISAEVEERRSNRSSNSIESQSRRTRSPSSVKERDMQVTVEYEDVDKDEIDLISAEVEERRSNRPSNSIESQSRRVPSHSSVGRDRKATVEDEDVDEEIDRISFEVEKRSNRPSNSIESQSRRARSPSSVKGRDRKATVEDEEDVDEEIDRISADVEERRSNRPSNSIGSQFRRARSPSSVGRSRQATVEDEEELPETPFPQIRGEHLERLFFSAPEHNAKTCTVCYRRRHRTGRSPSLWSSPYPRKAWNATEEEDEDEGFGEGSEEAAPDMDRVPKDNNNTKGKQRDYVHFSKDPGHWRQAGRREGLPPQTVVARVIRELEDDFTHYKSVYVELADQYKVMDAVSDVPRRNMLARHLREVVDILEQKGDQIASLYDLLSFKDKPIMDSMAR